MVYRKFEFIIVISLLIVLISAGGVFASCTILGQVFTSTNEPVNGAFVNIQCDSGENIGTSEATSAGYYNWGNLDSNCALVCPNQFKVFTTFNGNYGEAFYGGEEEFITDANIILDQADSGQVTENLGSEGDSDSLMTFSANLEVSLSNLEISGAVESISEETILVKNLESSEVNVQLMVEGFEEGVIFVKEGKKFVLAGNSQKTIGFDIIAPSIPGIYTGKILVNNEEILVNMEANQKEALLDAQISVKENSKIVKSGKLNTAVVLTPLGFEGESLGVTLNYVIKDFENKIVLSESETLNINGLTNFNKEFSLKELPSGDYIVGLELIYSNGLIVVTSDDFKLESSKSSYRLWIIIGVGLVIIFLILQSGILKKLSKSQKGSKKKK
jgi:hypothetical protein